MPISLPTKKSHELKERLRFLKPYIVWRRRKRQRAETRLLEEIIAEEKRNITIRRERRSRQRRLHEDNKRRIEEELAEVKVRSDDLEKRLQVLNDDKHELFMKLKCVLMTEDSQKKMRQLKDLQHPSAYGHLPPGQGITVARTMDGYYQNQGMKRPSPIMAGQVIGHHGNSEISTVNPSSASGGPDMSYHQHGYPPLHSIKSRVGMRYDGMAQQNQVSIPQPPFAAHYTPTAGLPPNS